MATAPHFMRVAMRDRRPIKTPIAELFDGVCVRRQMSLSALANEMGCDHSTLSRLRSGARKPSRAWWDTFVARCQLTEGENAAACGIFGFALKVERLPDAPMPEVLKGIRLRRGLNRSQVARRLGFHESAISRWESGERMQSLDALRHVVTLLELSDAEITQLGRAAVLDREREAAQAA